jgi:hypothetical protein
LGCTLYATQQLQAQPSCRVGCRQPNLPAAAFIGFPDTIHDFSSQLRIRFMNTVLIGIIVYILLQLLVGVYCSRKIASESDYLLAGSAPG